MNEISIRRDIRILEATQHPAEFWSILIDGREITDCANPFDAASPEIILNECDYCYCCGLDDISARLIRPNAVIWVVSLDEEFSPTVDRDTVFVFDRLNYEKTVDGTALDLPEFSIADLKTIVPRLSFFDWRDGLYTIPELPNDLNGKHTLRCIEKVLKSDDVTFRSDPPQSSVRTLRIGVDVENVPEVEVDFSVNSMVSFRLNRNPYLPIWLGPSPDSNPFKNYHAESELAM